MTWVKLDDTFPLHPKVLDAGDDAGWLFVCGLCHASRHLTDGFVSRAALGRLTGLRRPEKAAQRLVDVGLWVEGDGGWTVNGYDEWQRTRADIEAERESARERARKSRERAAASQRTHGEVTEPEAEADTEPPNPHGFAEQEPHADPLDPVLVAAMAATTRDALRNGQASELTRESIEETP